MTQPPAPGTPEWRRLITASKVPAILGVDPYHSPRSMWDQMTGRIPPDEHTAAMERGHLLEPALLAWWRAHHPDHTDWHEQAAARYGDWLLVTPDGAATLDGEDVLVECKTTTRDDLWGEPGTDQVPPHVLAQVLVQLHVTDAARAYVVMLGSRLTFTEYVVDRDPGMETAILDRLQDFAATLGGDTPPPLDDHPATYEAVRAEHPDIDRDASVELDPDMAWEWIAAKKRREAAEREERAAKTRLLDRMGAARLATHAGQTIARRQPARHGVSLVAVAKETP